MTTTATRTTGHMELTSDKAKLVARCKAEVLSLIEAERIPASVKDFSGLHDHIDANELGGFCDDEFNDWLCEQLRQPGEADDVMPDALIKLIDDVQGEVDAWITSGAMARERAAKLVELFKGRHPDVAFEITTPADVGLDHEEDTPAVLIVINTEDFSIADPLSSECGRFPVEPATYGINAMTAEEMRGFNNVIL